MHADLIARLEAAAARINERVLAEMLADPFWRERFGERAERHTREDGLYHLKYLIQALAVGDPNIMASYARWLQQVLTTRGMCTRHLDENFERLATAIAGEQWPDGEAAVAMLDTARAALRYPDGPARTLQDLAAAHPAFDLVSYAADALALELPEVFANHVAWLGARLPAAELAAARALIERATPEAARLFSAAPRS